MRTSKRALFRLGLPVLGFVAGAASVGAVATSCTIFNGVALPAHDGGGYDADSGQGGMPPMVEHYLSMSDAAKACSILRACPEPELQTTLAWSLALQIDATNFSQCMTWLAGPIPPTHAGIPLQTEALKCLVASMTCEDANRCFDYVLLPNSDTRCDKYLVDAGPDASAQACLDPETVIFCAPGSYQLQNCKSAGFGPNARCLTNALGPACAIDTCGGDTGSVCESSLVVYCSSGLKLAGDCAYQGNDCGFDPDAGYSRCLTDGIYQQCSGVGSSCAGDRVEVCNSINLASYDCKVLGGTCKHDHGPALCALPSDKCTPFDKTVNVCKDAKTLNLCVGGQPMSFDCSSIGKACKPDMMGFNAGCD